MTAILSLYPKHTMEQRANIKSCSKLGKLFSFDVQNNAKRV